jgi:hypothetical protein
MATKRATDKVKATVWTPSLRMDFESNRMGAVCVLFRSLDTQEARSEALKQLHQIDADMTDRAIREAAKDAETSAKASA